MKILFVGTFNPISLAHLKIARLVSTKYNRRTIFIPVSSAYNKASLNMPFIHRYNMIKEAIRDDDRLEVSDIEERYYLKFKTQPKTIETLKAFKDPYLLVGEDNYLNMGNWYKGEDILSNYHIIVYPKSNKLKSNSVNIDILDSDIIDISSSMIRDKIRANEDVSLYLDYSTIKYLKDNELYLFYH